MTFKIGRNCKLNGLSTMVLKDCKAEIIIGNDVTFGENVKIGVTERLVIGDRCIIGDNFIIEGRDIEIGREFWSGRNCQIGGGSCFEKLSSLKIGDQCHLGNNSTINTARTVRIGNEVGLGEDSKVYTHGAYLSYFEGFPVDFGPVIIEDKVWCPKAIIMPNVTIGHDTVVGAGAIVTKSLPCGCLAVGIPAKVIKENCYPKHFTDREFKSMLEKFVEHFMNDVAQSPIEIVVHDRQVFINGSLTLFDFEDMHIDGRATELTELFRNELRRWGIRFRYYNNGGVYEKW